jgi:hypothetical protein
MKYKVSVEIVEPEQSYSVRTVYEQILDDADVTVVEKIIKAANNIA